MTPEIRKLYGYHFFNSIATTVAASFLFIDKLYLRMELDMSQIGTIKGVGFWLAMTLNLALAPWIMRLKLDRHIVAWGYMVRIALPMVYLLLPQLTDNRIILTAACTVLLIASLAPALIANNSAFALCMRHIPRDVLGRHMSRINAVWNIPFLLLAIPCAKYIDHYAAADDATFYRAFLIIFLVTGVFQLPAAWMIWGLPKEAPNAPGEIPPRLRDVFEPFRHDRFRALLIATGAIATMSAMVMTFIYVYLMQAHQMEMYHIGILEAAAGGIGFLIMPLWGILVDRIGGRNVMTICALGIASATLLMAGENILFMFVAAALAWKTSTGIFGAGLSIGQQYLTMALADERRRNIYLAAATFVSGCGTLVGAVLGGLLLDWLKARVNPAMPNEHYRVYFLFCALMFLLTVSFIGALRDGRRPINPLQITLDLYRLIRTFAGKNR